MSLTRTLILSNTCIQYAAATPKSVVLILHGSAQRGTDKTLLENITFISRIKNGIDNPNRIVLIPQLPTTQGGWWANTLQPIFDYIATNYPTLPIDMVGFDDFGQNAMATQLSVYGGKLRSACAIAGGTYADIPNKVAYAKNIYSYLIYNGGDTTINNGAAIDDLEAYLRAKPVANNVCWKANQGGTPPNGVYGTHNAWDAAFTGIYGGTQTNAPYIATVWGWLDLNVDPDVANILNSAAQPVTPRSVYVNGTKIWNGLTQGDPTKVEVY